MYKAVLHLSLVSIIFLLLQKCTSSQMYLSTASKNCIAEKVFYILLRLYLLLVSVSSCTTSIFYIDHFASLTNVYTFTPVLTNCFKELYWWDSCLHSTAFIPAVSICIKLYCIYHCHRSSCFSCKSVYLHACTYQLLHKTVLYSWDSWVYISCQYLYQAVLHLSLISIILLLLQKCTSSHLYLSIVSMNCIPEIVVYILLRLYRLLAYV